MELPYYSKFLLIAAYLASYNSPKTDKRFFLKNAGKIRKRTKAARGPEIKQKMIGPLTFSIDRELFARNIIFYRIILAALWWTQNKINSHFRVHYRIIWSRIQAFIAAKDIDKTEAYTLCVRWKSNIGTENEMQLFRRIYTKDFCHS